MRLLAAVVAVAMAVVCVGVAVADPPADFNVSDSPTVGQPVTFTATGEGACSGEVTCTWDFGDPLGSSTGQGTASPTHTYLLPGPYTVTLTVSDPAEDSGPDETFSRGIVVAALPNVDPTVSVSGPASTFRNTATTFTMDARDLDGEIVSREWSVDGGAFSGGGSTFTTSFATLGPHTVTARVTDDDGGTATDPTPLTVTVANRAPSVSLAGPPTANIGVLATFAATGADPDGDALAYTWSVDGGSFVPSGASVNHAFTTAGTHSVAVRASDGNGGLASDSVTITVLNKPPTVDFSWSPKVVDKGDLVTFTSSSADPDGKPLSKQEWDLDGDGSYDDGFGDTATRTYTTTGSRTIGLRVTDADGDFAVGTGVLVPGNRPPQASFTAAPSSPLIGQTVSFASTSKDSDGRVASQAWDLNGDNVYGEGTGTTASASFATAGTHRVGLKVTDDDGSTDISFVNVEVKLPTPAASSGIAGVSAAKSLKILRPFPKVRFAGALTRRGALIKLLSVKAPKGAKISITCKKGCPRSKLAQLARTVRMKAMQGHYRSGAVLVVTVTKPDSIGKYTRITIVKGKAPKRIDRCLWPQSKKPRACPPGVAAS